jgi:hypothetical protein
MGRRFREVIFNGADQGGGAIAKPPSVDPGKLSFNAFPGQTAHQRRGSRPSNPLINQARGQIAVLIVIQGRETCRPTVPKLGRARLNPGRQFLRPDMDHRRADNL